MRGVCWPDGVGLLDQCLRLPAKDSAIVNAVALSAQAFLAALQKQTAGLHLSHPELVAAFTGGSAAGPVKLSRGDKSRLKQDAAVLEKQKTCRVRKEGSVRCLRWLQITLHIASAAAGAYLAYTTGQPLPLVISAGLQEPPLGLSRKPTTPTARTKRRHSFQKERQNDHIPKRNAREIRRAEKATGGQPRRNHEYRPERYDRNRHRP